MTLLLFAGFYLLNLAKFGRGASVILHVVKKSKLIHVGLLFWNGHHVRKQMLGLSLLYDRQTVLPEKRDMFREKVEKLIFSIFTATFLGRLFMSRYFGDTGLYKFFFWGVVVAEFTLCTALIVWTFFRSGAARNKSIYQIRLFFFPLSSLSILFDYALQAIHGIEYFFLTNKILDQSGLPKSKSRNILISGLLLGSCVFIPYYVLYFSAALRKELFGELVPLWALVVLGLAKTVVFLHFHIDGYLFRFSDPNVRKHIAPLLLSESSQPDMSLSGKLVS